MGFEDTIRKKLEDARSSKENQGESADQIILAATTVNAGLGVIPVGINTWTFCGVVTTMVVILGGIYKYHTTKEDASKLILHILKSVGLFSGLSFLGLKFFAEVLKGAGVITMGGATVGGMALDAVLCGGLTYAIGFTTKQYFASGKQMSSSELGKLLKEKLKEGKARVSQEKQGGVHVK